MTSMSYKAFKAQQERGLTFEDIYVPPVMAPDDLSAHWLAKHGQHDQKTHGNWANGRRAEGQGAARFQQRAGELPGRAIVSSTHSWREKDIRLQVGYYEGPNFGEEYLDDPEGVKRVIMETLEEFSPEFRPGAVTVTVTAPPGGAHYTDNAISIHPSVLVWEDTFSVPSDISAGLPDDFIVGANSSPELQAEQVAWLKHLIRHETGHHIDRVMRAMEDPEAPYDPAKGDSWRYNLKGITARDWHSKVTTELPESDWYSPPALGGAKVKTPLAVWAAKSNGWNGNGAYIQRVYKDSPVSGPSEAFAEFIATSATQRAESVPSIFPHAEVWQAAVDKVPLRPLVKDGDGDGWIYDDTDRAQLQ